MQSAPNALNAVDSINTGSQTYQSSAASAQRLPRLVSYSADVHVYLPASQRSIAFCASKYRVFRECEMEGLH
jgi:hypothetical protein